MAGDVPAIETVHDRCGLDNGSFHMCGVEGVVISVQTVQKMGRGWNGVGDRGGWIC